MKGKEGAPWVFLLFFFLRLLGSIGIVILFVLGEKKKEEHEWRMNRKREVVMMKMVHRVLCTVEYELDGGVGGGGMELLVGILAHCK